MSLRGRTTTDLVPRLTAALMLSAAIAIAAARAARSHTEGVLGGVSVVERHARRGGNCSTVFVVALTGEERERLRGFKELAAAMLRSALLVHPSTCAAVLSNEGGVWNSLRRAAGGALEEHVYGGAVFGGVDTFAYDRLKAYRNFLAGEAERKERGGRNVAFVDADILFVHGIEHVWRQRFDIGFTFRPSFQPVNTGVILVHRDSVGRAADLLDEVLNLYDALTWGVTPKAMLGDQAAASQWVTQDGSHSWDFRRMEEQRGRVRNYSVLLLPATEYNWTPRVGCRIPQSARVLHFKGREKGRMLRAWRVIHREVVAAGESGGRLDADRALNRVVPWIGVEEPENALHKARGTLIDRCPAM